MTSFLCVCCCVQVHELYTGACGLYLCLLGIRGITLLASWVVLGWTQVIQRLHQWGVMVSLLFQGHANCFNDTALMMKKILLRNVL